MVARASDRMDVSMLAIKTDGSSPGLAKPLPVGAADDAATEERTVSFATHTVDGHAEHPV